MPPVDLMIDWIGGLATFVTFGTILSGIGLSIRRPAGKTIGHATA